MTTMSKPSWLRDKTMKEKSLRSEKALAKRSGGRTYINSGATLGQNDVGSDAYDFEHKLTAKKSFAFKLETFRKLEERTKSTKTPVLVIEFEDEDTFVVLKQSDFVELHNRAHE